MKKFIVVFFALVIGIVPRLRADEGMWIPLLIKNNIAVMQQLGCKLTAEEIYSNTDPSIKDAIIIFGGGCTGEIVSPEGLIFTNHHCGFGSWYYNQGMKLFGKNRTFLAMQSHHEEFHNLINENLDCALNGGCMTKAGKKDEILARFKDAEDHSVKMFALMDQLTEELGDNIDMKEVLA